jgi:Mn-dependent DtxR family transcriptional regulator
MIRSIVLNTHESAENYLETILMLSRGGQSIRSVDIANELEYSKPSVSVAMKNLRAKGHIVTDADGYITLTESGKEIAQRMYERHMLISDWLMHLGVDRETAVHDACKMEHDMSEQSFTAIQKHVKDWKRGR